jgi:hypothetical protein
MKAETDSSKAKENDTRSEATSVTGSDSDSTSDEQTLHSAAPTEITEGETVASTDETLRGSTSTDTASTSSKQKKGTKASETEGSSSANNLVGKINNLVTTDLNVSQGLLQFPVSPYSYIFVEHC